MQEWQERSTRWKCMPFSEAKSVRIGNWKEKCKLCRGRMTFFCRLKNRTEKSQKKSCAQALRGLQLIKPAVGVIADSTRISSVISRRRLATSNTCRARWPLQVLGRIILIIWENRDGSVKIIIKGTLGILIPFLMRTEINIRQRAATATMIWWFPAIWSCHAKGRIMIWTEMWSLIGDFRWIHGVVEHGKFEGRGWWWGDQGTGA